MSADSRHGSSDSQTPDDLAQYLQVYIDESEEEIESLTSAILLLETQPHDSPALQKAFRMLHSLKGSSGMLGFETVGTFAHELEDRFERYHSGDASLDRDTTTLMLRCIDYFRDFINRLKSGDLSQADPTALLEELKSLEQSTAKTEILAPAGTLADRQGLPAMTVSGGWNVKIRFREGLQLADLKARLIVTRLSAIGEIIACDPPVDDVHSFEELALFSVTLVTTKTLDEVRKIARVEGVESVDVETGMLSRSMLEASAAPVVATPIASPPLTPPVPLDEPTTPPDIFPHEVATPEVTPPAAFPVAAPSVAAMAPETQVSQTQSHASDSIRVEVSRLDHLMNLTGELVIAKARFHDIAAQMSPLLQQNLSGKKSNELTQRIRQQFHELSSLVAQFAPDNKELHKASQGLENDLEELAVQSDLWQDGHRHLTQIAQAVDQLTRVSKGLQRGVLQTRMVPIGPLFGRFKRVVRDLSLDRGKQVNLIIQGEKTELDKRMIDALGDPLLHLVRNSIDHGLEPPEERTALGKSPIGTVVLEAAHRSNNVLITIRDDGRGINLEKIRSRIRDRGLASPSQILEMNDEQLISYIWHPGFSTAEAVSEVSGRGVGMDIVRAAISDLSGTIDITSTSGQGTQFTIKLPLTLAIMHCLLVKFEDDHFSIPIDDVREIVSISTAQIHHVQKNRFIEVRGELIPLVSMGSIFEWKSSLTSHGSLSRAQTDHFPSVAVNIVVLHSRGRKLGLSVDSLVGRAGLVIKSLTENFTQVSGLSGASILGDGSVCLMLDTSWLIDTIAQRHA